MNDNERIDKNTNKFPEHEFSKYIDQGMSFNNKVDFPIQANTKKDIVYQLMNLGCDGEMSLEPRLQEYIKKKKRYTDDNIKPCVPLEREFMITKDDISHIKTFMKGGKKIRNKKDWKKRNLCHPKPTFPSSYFDNDSRVPKPHKPEKHAQVTNRGMFYPGPKGQFYDENEDSSYMPIDSRDFKDNTGFELNDTRFDPRVDPHIYPGIEQHNVNTSPFKVRDPPKISHKTKQRSRSTRYESIENLEGYSDDDSNYSCDSNMSDDYMDVGMANKLKPGSVDTLTSRSNRGRKRNEPAFKRASYMDRPANVVVPAIAEYANKNITNNMLNDVTKDPRNATYLNEFDRSASEFGNADLETCLTYGAPTHTKKSYGFRNPVEHYYQYIDDDLQDPDHVVFPIPRGGISTRLDNTKSAKKPYYRDIV